MTKKYFDKVKELKKAKESLPPQITEQKRIEEDLARIAAEQENIMATISDGIYMLDMSGNLVNWNKAAEVVTGLSAEELMDKPIVELFAEEDRAAVAEAITKGLEEGIGEVTGSFLRKDRSPAIYQWSTVPLKDPQGKVIGLTGVGRDITEQKRIEEELARIAAEQKNIMATISDGIYMLDMSGNLVNWNKAAELVSGLSAKELMDKPIVELFAEEDRAAVAEAITKGLEEGIGEVTGSFLRKDRSPAIYQWSTVPLKDPQGKVIGLTGVGRDITEQKRIEEELARIAAEQKNIMATISDGIYMLDMSGNLVNWNKAAELVSGLSAKELTDKPIVELFAEEDRAAVAEAITKGLEEGIGEVTGSFLRKDRSPAIYQWSTVPLKDPQGKVIGLTGVGRDITEQKRIEKEARRHQNLESIGVLAGGIAHDFNNILTIILGNISLAKMYAKPEDKIYKSLVAAENGAMRAKDLTQQLLTFSKGGAPIKKIASIAEFLKKSASFALSGSNVKCIFSIPDDLWVVEIDKGQISQVFNNLVMNADQAMSEGGIININAENITITSENILSLQKGKYIKFSFEDHGIGIPAHHLDKIFDPYFSTKAKGSGLGLASAYSIIRNHNGLITVESELGIGTTFYIYLPASEKIIIEKEKIADKTLAGKGKILIMDDEELLREVVGKMLKSLGYSAELAKDGAEAIKLYKNAMKSGKHFSAVIMDLTIPGGMGGKEAIKELLKIDPEVKAIVSSGYSNDAIMSDCKKYGFVGMLSKPYKMSALGKTLKEIIGK